MVKLGLDRFREFKTVELVDISGTYAQTTQRAQLSIRAF